MKNNLKFREDRCFKIVQFTDIHWQNGEAEDQQSTALIQNIIAVESPELVVLTGDILAGGGCNDAADSMRQIVELLDGCGVPWAAVFGNHDDEGSADRQALMSVLQSGKLGLSEPGPAEVPGVGNYVLPIQSAESDTTAALLYFLDSGSYAQTGISGYDWIKREQIAWYLQTSADLHTETEEPLPALAFFHIPIPEYDEVWNFHTCYGVKYEDICAPKLNTGLFAAMHEAGDIAGIFVGHDHINDFWGDLHGIRLCYGRASGYHTYGREGLQRGGRVIQLQEGQRQFETWLRLADSTLVSEQSEHQPLQRAFTED